MSRTFGGPGGAPESPKSLEFTRSPVLAQLNIPPNVPLCDFIASDDFLEVSVVHLPLLFTPSFYKKAGRYLKLEESPSHQKGVRMARGSWTNSSLNFAIGALAIGFLACFAWAIALQATKVGQNGLAISSRTTYLIVDVGGNTSNVVDYSDNIDIANNNFFMVFSLVRFDFVDGTQRIDSYAILTLPFNGTSTGTEEAYVDVEIPTTFMQTLSFATSTPWFTSAIGSVDPSPVLFQAISPLQQGDLSYPPNWMRFSVRPLAGAVAQNYMSHSIRIEIYQL